MTDAVAAAFRAIAADVLALAAAAPAAVLRDFIAASNAALAAATIPDRVAGGVAKLDAWRGESLGDRLENDISGAFFVSSVFFVSLGFSFGELGSLDEGSGDSVDDRVEKNVSGSFIDSPVFSCLSCCAFNCIFDMSRFLRRFLEPLLFALDVCNESDERIILWWWWCKEGGSRDRGEIVSDRRSCCRPLFSVE